MLQGGKTEFWEQVAHVWLFHWSNQTWEALPDLAGVVSDHACAPFTAENGARMVITSSTTEVTTHNDKILIQ